MKPIIFDGCFGWLHNACGDVGVVLCNPYGHEAEWAHRGWRGLAEHLAEQNFPTMRFDYHGTGDASGSETDGDRIEAWVLSVLDAVHYFRATTSVRRVILCGVRLGGMLAALAASRLSEIDGLVLLSPVVSGAEYLRELKIIQRRWRNTAVPHITAEALPAGVVETLGYRLNVETSARLGGITLLREDLGSVDHVLILDPVKIEASEKLRLAYAATGAKVDVEVFSEYANLVSESIATPLPATTYAQLSFWIGNTFPSEAAIPALDSARLDDEPTPTACENEPTACGLGIRAKRASIESECFTETPVIFDGGRLFGIYCRPKRDGERVHAVLFPNTARCHHIGEARMWVTHARQLAEHGVASLRMDVGLLGDSAYAAPSVTEADLNASQSIEDVSAGIDWLVSEGHSSPMAVGICSGAYLSLHAAARNKAVCGVTLINQREYFWETGHEQISRPAIASTATYMLSLRSAAHWKRLFMGKIPIKSILVGLMYRQGKQLHNHAAFLLSRLIGTHSAKQVVREKFVAMAARGVDIRVMYGALDDGLGEAMTFLGKDFEWLKGLPGTQTVVDPAVDHALFLHSAREHMMQLVSQQLSARKARDGSVAAGGVPEKPPRELFAVCSTETLEQTARSAPSGQKDDAMSAQAGVLASHMMFGNCSTANTQSATT